MKNSIKNVFLFLTALIWGLAFVAQSVAMDNLSPYVFNCLRFIIGGITLFLFCLFTKRYKEDDFKGLIKGGFLCGLVLFAASTLQQIGLIYTSVGKTGFITVFYIVFVPILSIFTKKKPDLKTWLCVLVALYGLYLLCMKGDLTIEPADLIILSSALLFAIHIMIIDKVGSNHDSIALSSIQFITAALIGLPSLFIETFSLEAVTNAMIPLLYTGFMSTCVAYTFQVIGQKDNNPTSVSLILSLESVFAALGGFFILHEMFTLKEFIGCVLIFSAVIVIQLQSYKKKESANQQAFDH